MPVAASRRWLSPLRFRLRTLLVLVAVLALIGAYRGANLRQVRRHEEAARQLIDLGAEIIHVHNEPSWLIWLLGCYPEEAAIVSFAYAPLDDDAMPLMAHLNGLQTLVLQHTAVGDDGLAHLASQSRLVRLELNGGHFTDAALAHIAEITSLETLSLEELPVTDEGLLSLAPLPHLERLHLERTAVTDEGVSQLRALRNRPLAVDRFDSVSPDRTSWPQP